MEDDHDDVLDGWTAEPDNKLNVLDAYNEDESTLTSLRNRTNTEVTIDVEEEEGMDSDSEGADEEGSLLGDHDRDNGNNRRRRSLKNRKERRNNRNKSCSRESLYKKVSGWYHEGFVTLRTWLYLICLGTVTAIMSWLLDVMYLHTKALRTSLASFPFWTSYSLTLVWGIIFACLAVFCCKKLSVYAKGSGTPEMKTILAGTMILGPLSVRCFMAKLLGLVCAMVAGLSIGKEGPFIHMSCILGYQLTTLPYFSSIRKNERLLRQMLAAAVSAGITAAFGAPIGGVFFGIEVTVTYYFVNNMWRSYLCAVVCIVVDKILVITNEKEEFEPTTLAEPKFALEQLTCYVVLGIMCGLGGSAFVHLISSFQKLFNHRWKKVSGYITSTVVVILTVAVTFPIPFMQSDDIQISNQMFKSVPLDDSSLNNGLGYTWWTYPSIFVTLPAFTILKMILSASAVSLPIPCGLYLPMFAMGSTFGRFYGEILALIWPDQGLQPASYAIVGAAAWVGGATHTVSTAVIVFELTGQINHMIPVLAGVLVARALAPAFSQPLYDMLMSIKSLPYLAAAKVHDLQGRRAMDLVEENCKYLTTSSTYQNAYDLLMATAGKPVYEEVAVVDPSTMLIVGAVSRRALVRAIDNFAAKTLRELNGVRLAASTTKANPTSTATRASNGNSIIQKTLSIMSDLDRLRYHVTEYFAPETYALVSKEVESPKQLAEGVKDMFHEVLTFTGTPVSEDSTLVYMDESPVAISDKTPLTKVHFIFTITHWEVLFILHNGKFEGVLGKNQIAAKLDRRSSLNSMIVQPS